MPFLIRSERPEDAAPVAHLTTLAFAAAPHSSGAEAAIVEALRSGGALALSLVAEDGEGAGIVGHVAFSPVSVGGRFCGWFGLGPISVAPDRQRGGIGAALVRQGLARLRADGAEGCVLLGEPAYYGRFGFCADPRLRLPGVPPGYFQALPFGAAVPEGEVAFHAAFDAA